MFASDSTLSLFAESVHFRASDHVLHGELAYLETGRPASAVVIAGPHPLLGGNMRNNVVRRLAEGLAERGCLTLRFDYRGVGRSQGPKVDVSRNLVQFWKTSHVAGEMDWWQDVQAAVEFLQQVDSKLPLTLIGYSFGCALIPLLPCSRDAASVVFIAPTVTKHSFASMHTLKAPLLTIASEDDFATSAQSLDDWFNGLSMPRQLVKKRCDNHFFRGHEDWLVANVFRFLGGAGGDNP
jgi:alpha/beta superfamily hydrolase